jgi:putative transposase
VRYVFIAEQEERFPVCEMCRVMDVSRSGYYDWCERAPSPRAIEDEALTKAIEREFKKGRRKYGSPKVWRALQQLGQRHSRKRVARLMKAAGLYGRKKKRNRCTTKANPSHRPSENLLNREFTADGPNRKWLSDITQIDTEEGPLYLAVTLDLYARRVVGWAMDDTMEATLTRRSFEMAVERRKPQPGLLHHSDRGSQFTDQGFRQDLRDQDAIQSMSRKANCWDNAPMESFFAQLEIELLQDRHFLTHAQTKQEVFDYVEIYYNQIRIHSANGYLSPAQYEAKAQSLPKPLPCSIASTFRPV